MKEIKFYKYFEDLERHYHFWETTNNVGLKRAEENIEIIKATFPNVQVTIMELPMGYFRINVKFYSDEDNAAFCLIIGSN